ncbi:YdeI/OmpD-associated family protein [Filimonas effusa]
MEVKSRLNASVNQFLDKATRWKDEMTLLRTIVLEAKELSEDYKWMHPCYTLQGKNVVLIHGFKEYCALLFHKGALLKDDKGILIRQTENVQSARQLRFTELSQVKKLRSVIKDYIQQAIEMEKSGSKVALKKTSDYAVPDEFQKVLKQDPAVKTAFNALTPGRQRAYLFYFSQAKQAKTRESRIEKCIPKILERKGLDD